MNSRAIILFRCDGAPEIGFGHVVRCLALAAELRDRGCLCAFAVRKGPEAVLLIQRQGFPVLNANESFESVARQARAAAIVLDVRDKTPRAEVRRLRKDGVLIATIDDPTDRRLDADLAFYPPIPQLRRMKWRGFTGKILAGWKWVVLRTQFAMRAGSQSKIANRKPKILVTMGGSDPAGLTLKAVMALSRLHDPFKATVLLGPAFCHDRALARILKTAGSRFVVKRNVLNVAALMKRADLAVASFGVTAYELAACGVPAVHLCLTKDHAVSASALVRERMAVSVGVHRRVSVEALSMAVRGLLTNARLRRSMSARCRRNVDGQGAERIARIVSTSLQHRSS